MSEADLYTPIKLFLVAQGYTVKGEIGACDIVALRDDNVLIIELKKQFNLALLLQAVDRLRLSETVYIAFRVGKGQSASWRTKRKQVLQLLRRLGVGLLTVSSRDRVVAELDPLPYQPRRDERRRGRLLKEFAERIGDPEAGGSASKKRLTAYRQDALRCALRLSAANELKLSEVREKAGVDRAGAILRDNHYGWFERTRRGYYALSSKGKRELPEWSSGQSTTSDQASLSTCSLESSTSTSPASARVSASSRESNVLE